MKMATYNRRRKPTLKNSMYVIGYLFVGIMITIVIVGVLGLEQFIGEIK